MVCRKLIKWTFFGTVGAVAAGYLFFGTNLPSYVSTAFGDVQEAVKGSVPLEFELRRARNLIKKIDPEIDQAKVDVARAEVELEDNQHQVRKLREAIGKAETKMQRHRGYLNGEGEAVTVFGSTNTTYATSAVRRELCRTFDMYRNQVELLKSKEALGKRQSAVLQAARSKLVAVRGERNKLMDLVETLEARKRQQDAMAASMNRFDLDTSALSQAKATLAEIKKKLDVSSKIIQEELFLAHGIVETEQDESRDIVKEMDEYFGQSSSNAKLSKVRTLNGK